MKIMSIAGARPNFIKLAALSRAIDSHNQRCAPGEERIDHTIVHTGQHYDARMSRQFFDELDIPRPDINLGAGSASHAVQTAIIMQRFEPVLLERQPDVLIVVGDINSTIACSLVAAKINYDRPGGRQRPVIVHVEAGLRSFDRDMPEEINRILTDSISDLLFITEESGYKNLTREGVDPEKIHFAGNVMIDTLQRHLQEAEKSRIREQLHLNAPYALVTLHRPSNVDNPEVLESLINCLVTISSSRKLVFPVHPRTGENLKKFGLLAALEQAPDILLTPPLSYLDFLCLIRHADLVITDSGGIQEETTVLNIPCVTLRDNTERPVTVDVGSNYLIGTSPDRILKTIDLILAGRGRKARIPKYWDGRAGERIIATLLREVKGCR